MTVTKIVIFFTTLLIAQPSLATSASFDINLTPIVDINMGEQNKNIEAITQYSNGCFEPWYSAKGIEDSKLILVHLAQYYTNLACTRAFEFKKIKFNVENLENGKYRVVDGKNGEQLGVLKVINREATLLN